MHQVYPGYMPGLMWDNVVDLDYRTLYSAVTFVVESF